MREYHFSTGMPITDFDPTPWILSLQVVVVSLLIAAIVLLIWRCFRKVSLWDIAGWGLLVVLEWVTISYASRFLYLTEDRFTANWVLGMSVACTTMLAIVAVNIVILRYVNTLAYNVAILFLEGIGICCLAMPSVGNHPKEMHHRLICKNRLKQIGLALHNYHDVWNSFPPAGDASSEKGLAASWRVLTDPYVEAAPLRYHYRFGEPWDSPFNTTIQKLRPDYLACSSHPADTIFTAYAMLRGPGTIGGDGSTAVGMKEIKDGTSNTFLVVEACGREIIWTEPKDVEVTDASLGINLPGDRPGRSRGIISSYHVGGGHVVFGDGAVRFVSEKIDKSVLKALTTINGGEEVRLE